MRGGSLCLILFPPLPPPFFLVHLLRSIYVYIEISHADYGHASMNNDIDFLITQMKNSCSQLETWLCHCLKRGGMFTVLFLNLLVGPNFLFLVLLHSFLPPLLIHNTYLILDQLEEEPTVVIFTSLINLVCLSAS